MKFATTAYHKLTYCTVAYRVILSLVTLMPYQTHEAANSRWSGHTEGALEAPRAAPEQVDEFPQSTKRRTAAVVGTREGAL